MAIVLQEEKRKINWVSFATIFIIIVVLFAGGYYLFFEKPELIEIVAPVQLDNINELSRISFDPESVVNSPTFKLLRQFESDIVPPVPGRSNPFRAF